MPTDIRPITVLDFLSARSRGARLTMLTCYDYSLARILDDAGVDCILVGDSLGMVIQGHPNPLPVTLEHTLYHTQCVARGVKRSLLIADMPYMTYQVSPEQALINAGRLVQEGGAHGVKIEGGRRMAKTFEALARAEIPILGHIGLTAQSLHHMGGFKVQRDEQRLLDDAKAVADGGAFAMVLECIPSDLAAKITASVPIPTIGIGAGPACDGQVLVLHDILGMYDDLKPKFVKRFAELGAAVRLAVTQYCDEVKRGQFPGPEHGFK